jgi:hypothetical protein
VQGTCSRANPQCGLSAFGSLRQGAYCLLPHLDKAAPASVWTLFARLAGARGRGLSVMM